MSGRAPRQILLYGIVCLAILLVPVLVVIPLSFSGENTLRFPPTRLPSRPVRRN